MKKLFLPIILLVLLITGCKAHLNEQHSNKKIIAVSIAPQSTLAEKICSDKFQILTAIPAGASPETYEPNPTDLRKINEAELYFGIGVPSEENFILPALSTDIKKIELHNIVKEYYPEINEANGRDPHIWLSPKRSIVMVRSIAEEVIKIDPKNKDYYQKNADEYIKELTELDAYIKSVLEPIKNRKFLVFHPAFSYFAQDYNLSMLALEEHGKETTAKQLSKMANLARREDIKIIFYQAEGSKKQAIAFAEEINGKAVMLEPLAANYTENLKKMTNEISKAMK